jgi:hypothetical protein
LNFTQTNSTYSGNKYNDGNTPFIFNNIGYVYTKNRYNETGLQSINFGIAYNRLADFYSDAYVRNPNPTSSLLDEFVCYANGYANGFTEIYDPKQLDPFYEGLAYDLYAIDRDTETNQYFSDYNLAGNTYGQPIYRKMNTRGGIGEYDFSIGFNINHKIFLGTTLGIQDVFYKTYYFHEETPDFEYIHTFNFSDEQSINGIGINLKTGIIYRPIQMLRLGAAIHTPTAIRLKKYSLTAMEAIWNTYPITEDGNDPLTYMERESDTPEKFRITTPWRYNLSVAAIIGSIGLIDIDVEFVDYAENKLRPNPSYDIENADINAVLQSAINVKTGVELRLGALYLRGGFAYYGNPYNKKAFDEQIGKTLTPTISYSAGIGFRKRDFFMDAALAYMPHPDRVNNLYMYAADLYEQATLQNNATKFLLTFGWKF